MDNMKKALLAVSFGTSYRESREVTIEAIEKDLAAAFPERDLFTGWTSTRLAEKVYANEGLKIDTVEEALINLKQEGYTDILVQPTHLIDGFENRRLRDLLDQNKESFEKIKLGRPLLSTNQDLRDTANALKKTFPQIEEGDALALMGHGSPKQPNTIYTKLEDTMRAEGVRNFFVGTVEGLPGIGHIMDSTERFKPERVWLAPLMIVAGDHALNDLAGSDEDSWRSQIESIGFETVPYLHGLGESAEIRRIYVKHAEEAECITA